MLMSRKHILSRVLIFYCSHLFYIRSRKIPHISFKSSYIVPDTTKGKVLAKSSRPATSKQWGLALQLIPGIYLEIKPLIFVRAIDSRVPMNSPEVTVGCDPQGPSSLPARSIVDRTTYSDACTKGFMRTLFSEFLVFGVCSDRSATCRFLDELQ